MDAPVAARTRRLILFVTVLVLVAALLRGSVRAHSADACGTDAFALDVHPRGGPTVCAHYDEPPAGVDVTTPVPTAELAGRLGAGAQAYAAAQDAGVPAPSSVAISSPNVRCDGDGTSGFRVQPMYVVEAGKTNRYSALLSSFQLWAAGVDDVVNRSAALTGGVRNVRYVTDPAPSGSGCVAHVLNVTVPAGSMTSFGATINAVSALGFNNPARKYLMWTDATNLCGVATVYPDDNAAQTNANNGFYPQYARIDSGCWGYGDGSYQHSVEAHELTHTLGSVLDGAPHSTKAGHCWDESDTMCYADGGTHAMVQICPTDHEYLLDCSSDDYFSTYPDPGSWLAGHWNAANSQFLVGGGNGTTGGQAGSPTTLGAQLLVNNPAVPGLGTQVQVTPSLPVGDAVASVAWKAARTDCVFADPTAAQTEVICNASSATGTTVTVTVTDTAGAVKTVSSPLTFSTSGTKRAVTVVAALRGETGADEDACTGASTPLRGTVIDTATGTPIKGLVVKFSTQTGTALPVSVGSGSSDASGTANGSFVAKATTLLAASSAVGAFDPASAANVAVTTHVCTLALGAAANLSSSYYADPVVVSGVLTRDGGLPVSGATVAVTELTNAGTVVSLGSVKTLLDGSYRASVKPTASGTLRAQVAAATGWSAVQTAAGSLIVLIPDTVFTASADKTDIGYGTAITVRGTLARDAGGTVTPLSGSVKVTLTAPGKAPVTVGSGSASKGVWAVSAKPLASGVLAADYQGAPGQPPAHVDLGQVTVGTWTASLTLAAKYTTQPASTSNTLTGTVTRTYNGATGPAPSVTVRLYLLPASGGSPVLLRQVVTSTSGTYTGVVYPAVSGTLVARIVGVAGYADASSPGVTLTVT